MSRILTRTACLLLSFLLLSPGLMAQDADPPPPGEENEAPGELVTRAEVHEIEREYDEALALRRRALEGYQMRIDRCTAAVATARERLAAGDVTPEERAFAETWIAVTQEAQARFEQHQARCRYWVDQLEADGHGHMEALRRERHLVWEREGEVSDQVGRVRELEAEGNFERAHIERRRIRLKVLANHRFYDAKIDALETMENLAERSRQLRDTEAAEMVRAQIAYYEWVMEYTLADAERWEQVLADETSVAWNRARAAFWEALPRFAATYEIDLTAYPAERRAAAAERYRGRAAYYLEEQNRDADDEGGAGDSE